VNFYTQIASIHLDPVYIPIMQMVQRHSYHPEFIADRIGQQPNPGSSRSNYARVVSLHHENDQNQDQQRLGHWDRKVASARYLKDSTPIHWPVPLLAGQLHRSDPRPEPDCR
jgi:hypothetical protein